jgi:hypothetical protein
MNDSDYATVKYNPNGIQQWVARYHGPMNGGNRATAIGVDRLCNLYVTGYSAASADSTDYATLKYDSNGVQSWVARYNGPGNGSDIAEDLVVDLVGNVYVTGYSPSSGTGTDYATIKYGQ